MPHAGGLVGRKHDDLHAEALSWLVEGQRPAARDRIHWHARSFRAIQSLFPVRPVTADRPERSGVRIYARHSHAEKPEAGVQFRAAERPYLRLRHELLLLRAFSGGLARSRKIHAPALGAEESHAREPALLTMPSNSAAIGR